MNESEIELEWMPVYWERLLAGTTHMDSAEFGAYMLLIVEQWKKGFVSSDHKRLLKITRLRSKEKLLTVLEKFNPDGKGNLMNEVCAEIRKQQVEKYLRYSKRGKTAADKRWNVDATSIQQAYNKHIDNKKEEEENKEIPKGIIHQHQHAHEVFAKKIFIEECDYDRVQLELGLKERRLITEADCQQFNAHLHTEGRNHVHFGQWKAHLRNWLNTRPSIINGKNSSKQTSPKNGKDLSSTSTYENSKSVL